jgi:hypothetical protein
MMKGTGIIKLKNFEQIFKINLIKSNLCKIRNNLTYHFLVEILNLFWEGCHHLDWTQSPRPT